MTRPFPVALLVLLATCQSEPEAAAKPRVDAGQAAAGGPSSRPAAAPLPAVTPEVFRVEFRTTKGPFVVEAHRAWAPRGVDRFFELLRGGFYRDIAFFRVIDGFVAQFGIHGDPEQAGEWRGSWIEDDPVKQSNVRGTLTFATSGKDSRTTQMFVNLADNTQLDAAGFAPFAKVVSGMEVVERLFVTGEGQPAGPGPRQNLVQYEGNAYLAQAFPELDYIRSARLVEPGTAR